jgi:acetylglutamate kinase
MAQEAYSLSLLKIEFGPLKLFYLRYFVDKMNAPKITVVKIGGHVIDDDQALNSFLKEFSAISGLKVLIHGGGKVATTIAKQIGIPQTMIEGRRVTDAETLKVITMVYGGLVNKKIVASLQSLGIPSLGVTGADSDLIRSKKRSTIPIDYGFVGDVEKVNFSALDHWISQGLVPVVAPLTHDGQGQILNTNADSIATAIAVSLSQKYEVTLFYAFEKKGVLMDVSDESTAIPEMNFEFYQKLRAEKKIFEGMIPKLDNAFLSIRSGVTQVIIGKNSENGTRITQ